MPNDNLYEVDLVDAPPGQKTAGSDDLYGVDLLDAPPGQEDLNKAQLLDQPPGPAEPVKVLPPREVEEPTTAASPWAKAPSPYYQAPLPFPEPARPEPVETFGLMPKPEKRPVDAMAEAMQQWGQYGRWRFPTAEDVEKSKGVAIQTYRGLQQAPFKLSESAQNAMALLSEFMAQAQETPQVGAWAPPRTAEDIKQSKEFWRGLSKHFQETAKIPRAYTEAIETIATAEPGSKEVRQVTSAMGSIIPSLAAAPIGFPAMVAMAGIQQAGDSFNESLQTRLDKGEAEEDARKNALFDGTVQGILTAIVTAAFGKTGIDSVVKAQASKATKGAIVEIAREMGFEAAEESIDQLLQVIYSKMRLGGMNLRDAVAYAFGPEGRKEIAIAGISGAVAAGPVSTATEISRAANRPTPQAVEYLDIADQVKEVIDQLSQPEGAAAPPAPQPVLPAIPGVQGAQIVTQALEAGLPRTAAAVAQDVPGLAIEESGIPYSPIQAPLTAPVDVTAGQPALMEPRPVRIPPGAPATPILTAAQPSQAETTVSGPAPQPVEGAPGVPLAKFETEQGRALWQTLTQMYPQVTEIAVVDNGTQFSPAIQADLRKRGLKPENADAVFDDGVVVFNAEKFPVGRPALVMAKVVHEVAIHLGLRRALGPERFKTLARSVWETLTAEERGAIAARNRISPENIEQIGEEWLAYEAERVNAAGKTNTTWSKIADTVRQLMRSLGITTRYSDTEIAQMISKGFRAATQPGTGTTYGPGSPLASVSTIRYSYAEVEKAKLEGEREYSPEIINAGIEGAFDGVKKMLYIEARSLSDLIPPDTAWHQPREGMSLIEYVRQFYSPAGIATIQETMAGDKPPAFVEDKANWYRIKAELNAVTKQGAPTGLGATFLALNRKAGGWSWDFGLGTCMPSENCSVCYAKGVNNPLLGTQARVRHSLVTAMAPEIVGDMIARFVTSKDKGDLPFLRINGAGDTTFPWQATAINSLIQTMDRPVHIFSRSHVSRARGTIGLDSISNGQYDPADVENGCVVYKMGSIDRQLVREYGIPFLKENLARRGILNSYLVKDVDDIPVLKELQRQGVFLVLHINRTNAVTNALREANLIANEDNPELNVPSCYCALESGPFYNGCATCLVGGGPCFAMGTVLGMTPTGQMVQLDKLLTGEVLPPNEKLVQVSRIGQPANRSKTLADVAAKSYEMAASDLKDKIRDFENGKKNSVIVQNPRDRTGILVAKTKAEVQQAKQIVQDWNAYAKWLRGLAQTFEQSAGFYRYVAEAKLEEALDLDRAMTEGIGAAARAAASANPLYSITQGVPQKAWDVAAMSPKQFAEAARNMQGGLTGEAVRVGSAVNDPQGIDRLREWQAQAQAESRNLMAAGDLDSAMAAASKSQFFREAVETATRTGSMGHALQTGRVKADIIPATQAEGSLGNVAKEGPPPGKSEVASLMPPSEVIPEHDDDYLVRYSISGPVQDPYVPGQPISNESMDRALREAGRPGLRATLGKPDPELMAAVQDKMLRFPHWVDTLIEREKKKPGLLSDEETIALDIYMLQLRTAIHALGREADAAEAAAQAGNPDEAGGHMADAAMLRQELDTYAAQLEALGEITSKAGTEAGRAFRARQLAAGWDFTLERLIIEKRRAKGWNPLTQDERAELEKKARDYERRTAELEATVKRLQEDLITKARTDAQEEILRVNPQVLEFATEWVNNFRKRRRNATDRFKVKWARAFPETPLRTSVSPGAEPQLDESLMRELAIIGASFLAENVTEPEAWTNAMVEEVGNAVLPYLPGARRLAEQHLADELAKARTEMQARRAPRKPPGAAPAPQAEPTIEDEIEVTKAKIHQVAEHQKTDTEANRGREDDIFYPVQKLVRQFVEQNPFITNQELIDQVHAVLIQDFPDWGLEETRDAISGRGRWWKPSQEGINKTVRDLKAQVRILGHIADVEQEQPLPLTGGQRDKPSDAQRRLLQRLQQAKRVHGEVVTNPEAQLASYLQSRKTFYRNRMADLQWEISNRQLIVRKSARAGETDQELEDLKAEYRRTKDEHDAIFAPPELSDQQRLERAEKAAERLILKLEQDLAAGRKTFAGKRDPVMSAKLEAQRTRIAQLKAEQEWAQMALNPPPDLKKPEDIRRWFQLEKEIRRVQEQLDTKQVFTPKKAIREETATNQALVQKLEDLKRQRAEMREQLRPTRIDPATRAINMRIAQIKRQIADFQQRLADGNFEPRKKKETPDYVAENPEVIRMLAQREVIKRVFANELIKDRWAKMNTVNKLWQGIKFTRNAVTNLRSSFDFSGARQGMLALLSLATRLPTQPIKTSVRIGTAFRDMFRAAWDRKKADDINMAIRKKRNWTNGAYKLMDIKFSDIEAPSFNVWEENARSVFDEWSQLPIWGKDIKAGFTPKRLAGLPFRLLSRPVSGSNRAFATFLNVLRSELADALLETNFKDRPPTLNDYRILGNWVNVATGRGYVSPRMAEGWSQVLWAPKLLMSRVQFLTGQPLWGGGDMVNSARARKIIATEYARVIGSGALLYLISQMFDEKKERDPRSSDVGKIVRGNTRIDIWGGHQQLLTFASRMITGKTKTLKGTVVDLTGAQKYDQGGLAMVLLRFFRSKVRPDIGVALDLAFRKDYKGDPVSVPGVLQDLLVPLPFADLADILKDRGWTEGAILEIMNQFGAGVNTYEDSNPQINTAFPTSRSY